jgi:hypothetical protein
MVQNLMDGDGGYHLMCRKDFPGGWSGVGECLFIYRKNPAQNEIYGYMKSYTGERLSP